MWAAARAGSPGDWRRTAHKLSGSTAMPMPWHSRADTALGARNTSMATQPRCHLLMRHSTRCCRSPRCVSSSSGRGHSPRSFVSAAAESCWACTDVRQVSQSMKALAEPARSVATRISNRALSANAGGALPESVRARGPGLHDDACGYGVAARPLRHGGWHGGRRDRVHARVQSSRACVRAGAVNSSAAAPTGHPQSP